MDHYMLKWLTTVIDTGARGWQKMLLSTQVSSAQRTLVMRAAKTWDGSGRRLVQKIEGMAPDSCVYHLTNHAPVVPHPYPHSAWHVNVCIGGTVRE